MSERRVRVTLPAGAGVECREWLSVLFCAKTARWASPDPGPDDPREVGEPVFGVDAVPDGGVQASAGVPPRFQLRSSPPAVV